ncbi:phage tail protein I [Photobacterium sp. DNB22_13_2]
MSGQSKPFVSVQPENRTVIEESLEFAWHQAINLLVDPFPELKQPLYSPDEFVALLAAERGVMDWRPEDTLDQQRKTADKAFEIHRKAGTRHGLSVAMDALDCDIEVSPWYQMDKPPGPYHIEVIAWKRSHPANKRSVERMLSRIEHTKSERDTVELIVAHGNESGFRFSGIAQEGVTNHDDLVNGVLPPSPVCLGSVCWGGATRMVVISEMNPGATA